MSFDLPRIGASITDNLIACLLRAGNRSGDLRLGYIARCNNLNPAAFTARFLELETQYDRQPHNSFEEGEGE